MLHASRVNDMVHTTGLLQDCVSLSFYGKIRGPRALFGLRRLVPEPLFGFNFSLLDQTPTPHARISSGFCETKFNGFHAFQHRSDTGNSREQWLSLRLAAHNVALTVAGNLGGRTDHFTWYLYRRANCETFLERGSRTTESLKLVDVVCPSWPRAGPACAPRLFSLAACCSTDRRTSFGDGYRACHV